MKWILAVAVVIGTSCVDEPRPKLHEFPPSPPIKVMPGTLKSKPIMPSPRLESSPMPKPNLSNDQETFYCDVRDGRLVNCKRKPPSSNPAKGPSQTR
jgi:hypothetical protein